MNFLTSLGLTLIGITAFMGCGIFFCEKISKKYNIDPLLSAIIYVFIVGAIALIVGLITM